jgi:pimeloyl-ACP methyl ester carboxylesterase
MKKYLLAASALFFIAGILLVAVEFYFTDKVIAPPRLSYKEYILQKPGTPPSLESLKIKYENILVTTEDRLKLSAWYIPNKKKTPLLLLHGHGANRMSFMKQVSYLYEAGYPLVLFDFRGSGLASGKYVSMGVHEAKDIKAMIDYLQKQHHFNHFGILSNSMGANAALLAAAKDKRITAVICDSPYTSLVDVVTLRGKKDFPFLPNWFFKLGFKVMA